MTHEPDRDVCTPLCSPQDHSYPERVRDAVLAAFASPSLDPGTILATVRATDPDMPEPEVKGAIISLVNRGVLDLGWDGRLRRVRSGS